MKPLLLLGCGGHAKSVIDVLEMNNEWKLIGLVGLPEQLGLEVLGYRVIGDDKDLPELKNQANHAFLAMGQLPSAKIRQKLATKIDNLGFHSPKIISPNAVISPNACIKAGTFVGHGAIINASATIGRHCIINSMSLIEHDAIVENYCHISTGAIVNGGLQIGAGSFIGSGAMLREGLNLPPNTIIHAGKRVMGWPLL